MSETIKMMARDNLRVIGAREHNLKNITVEIPRDKFVVITGLSGSGKSSLAFDTIFAEGQRRYVESLSAYARQFLGQMSKPDVDSIEGLSPAVSIDQKATSHNPRSTVGTVTEIYDYLRLLYARVGIPHCPICGRVVQKQSAQEIVEDIEALPPDSRLQILSPLVRERKGTYQAVFEEIRKAGFVRVRVDGETSPLDEEFNLDRYKKHTIEAVVDRLILREPENEEDAQAARSRLTDSVETALKFGDGYITVQILDKENPRDIQFSEHLACPEHGSVITEIEPRTFSFNTPHGACPTCQGLGSYREIDPGLLIPNRAKSFKNGAILDWAWNGPKDDGGYYWQMLEAVGRKYDIDLEAPVNSLSEEKLNTVLYGTGDEELTVEFTGRNGRKSSFKAKFEGVIPNMERRFRETNSEHKRGRIAEFMNDRPCPTCGGDRLRQEALAVTMDDKNIVKVTKWPVHTSLEWVDRLSGDQTPFNNRRRSSLKGYSKRSKPDWVFWSMSASTISRCSALRDHSPAVRPNASGWPRKLARA